MLRAIGLLLIAAVLVSVWLYVRWQRVKRYWKERNVPFVPPHPVLGNLTFMQKINASLWMRQIYEKFKTPYVGIWWFWRPALVINSPDIARQILVKDCAIFRDRFLTCGDNDPIGKFNLFAVKDPLWTNIRRRLTGTFTSAKLRALQDFIRSKSKELVHRIKNEQECGLDLRGLFIDYSTDVIGTSAFGVKCNATLTGRDPFRQITKDFMKFSPIRGLGWSFIFFFPELVNIFRVKMFPKSSTDFFKKVFKNVVKQREENSVNSATPKDLLDALLRISKETNNDEFECTEDVIIAQAIVFLSGGFDTSGTILAFATYELAFNHQIQEKLYNELFDMKERNGSDVFTEEQLAESVYLNCVIKETLRKYSPMSWLDRVAATDYKIDDNLTIKAGTPVYINGIGMHFDPEYFPNPNKFDPERFLPENEKNIKPYTYLPFGGGPRICIGLRFGMMTLRFAMSSVFLNYAVQRRADTPHPLDVQIEKRGIFYVPGELLRVQFVPRTSS